MQNYNLQRFVEAHQKDFNKAFSEVKNGRKRSHWMWYIFPQIKGLGQSQTAQYYAIQNLEEAVAFLQEPYLSSNLYKICNALLCLEANNIREVFDSPDDKKLRSSITLFEIATKGDPIFKALLDKYFGGTHDYKTIKLLGIKEEKDTVK